MGAHNIHTHYFSCHNWSFFPPIKNGHYKEISWFFSCQTKRPRQRAQIILVIVFLSMKSPKWLLKNDEKQRLDAAFKIRQAHYTASMASLHRIYLPSPNPNNVALKNKGWRSASFDIANERWWRIFMWFLCKIRQGSKLKSKILYFSAEISFLILFWAAAKNISRDLYTEATARVIVTTTTSKLDAVMANIIVCMLYYSMYYRYIKNIYLHIAKKHQLSISVA